MAYFIYPETPTQLGISTDVLSDNGVKFRVSQEYEHNPAHPFVAKIKNYVLEILCDYERFCFMKHLIGERLDNIIYLEKKLELEYKPAEGSQKVDIPEFMKEEVKQ